MGPTLDLGDRDAVRAQARLAPPEVVINPAAMTNVDACESRREEAAGRMCSGRRWSGRDLPVTITRAYCMSPPTMSSPAMPLSPDPIARMPPRDPSTITARPNSRGDQAVQRTCGECFTPYAIVRTALVYGQEPARQLRTWLAGELRPGGDGAHRARPV